MEKLLEILKSIKPDVDFTKEENLIEDRVLTSFDIIRLVAKINSEFDVEITPLHILPENFKSAKAIMSLIERIEEDD